MKLIKDSIVHFSLVMLCIGLAGCVSPGVIVPLGSGYEEVNHPHRFMSAAADRRVSFQHRAPDGSITLIWPSLYGVNEVVKGDLAIFVGDRAYVSSDPDDPRGTKARLFAVRAPDLPLDITDEVLWRWSRTSGKNFAKASAMISLMKPVEKNGRLELYLIFETDETDDWPDAIVQLDWTQVSDIMREVKAKGVGRKDLRWGTPYIVK
jgi:hypothetical protein